MWGAVDWTSISKAIETFLAAPAGQLLLLIAFVSITLWGLYALRRLEISNARNQREADLAKQRLDIEQKENERQAINDATLKALLNEVVKTQTQLTAIVGRLEPKLTETTEVVKQTKENTDALAIRVGNVHTDLRRGITTVASKIDNANNESRSRWETTQQVTNNRSQEQIKAFHSIGDNIQTSLTKQDGLLDQMLHKLVDVVSKLDDLRTDIRANTTAQANAVSRKDDELKALNDIKHMMNEVLAGIVLLKKHGDTGKLDPATVPAADPIAVPTVIAAHPDPVHDTAQLTFTPKAVDMPDLKKDSPNA